MTRTRPAVCGLLAAVLFSACSATHSRYAPMVDSQSFGRTAAGDKVQVYTLRNSRGLEARVSTLGATLVSMEVPDRDGRLADVVLGFDDAAGYQSDRNQYFGCTTGRVANRIAKGRFELNGEQYQLAVNNGPNHLHGGTHRSLDKVIWDAEVVPEGVRFSYTSPDGEEGYPGELEITVTYSLDEADVLRISYEARTDAATPVNLTNHAYWNLGGAGHRTILDHELMIEADQYTPTDETLIPTGLRHPVAGTALDLRRPTRIGEQIKPLIETPALGFDHNFVLRGEGLKRAARLHHPGSGRVLEVWTTEPGLQFYSGNYLSGQRGKMARAYPLRSALCLEAQHFPDSVNQPAFPSTILQPGATYRQVTEHRFSVTR